MNRRSFLNKLGGVALAMAIGLERIKLPSFDHQKAFVHHFFFNKPIDPEHAKAMHQFEIRAMKPTISIYDHINQRQKKNTS